MTEARQVAMVRDSQEAQCAFRERAEELKIPREVLDELTGLPKGYSGKVLANPPAKGLGHVSFWTMLGALGLAVMLVEDERRMVRVNATAKRLGSYPEKRNWRNAKALAVVTKWARAGAKKRRQNMTDDEYHEHQSHAAKMRWRKFRRERAQAQRAARSRRSGRNTSPGSDCRAPAPRLSLGGRSSHIAPTV